jgi:STE24 endopeptidase
MPIAASIILLLIVARCAAQLWLEHMNSRHVRAHAGAVPEPFREVVDDAAYARSVQYTLAQGRLDQVETAWDTAVLVAVLFSGVLPWGYDRCAGWLGSSAWALAGFRFATGVVLSLPGLPL